MHGRYPCTAGPEMMVHGVFCKRGGSVLLGMGLQAVVCYADLMPWPCNASALVCAGYPAANSTKVHGD